MKFNNAEKRIHLDSIINVLICEQIPFEYNARELVIKLKGIDMTDVLLAIHDYNDERMTDLYKKINYLSEQIQELKIELDTPESVVLDKLDEAKEIIRDLLFHLGNTFIVSYTSKEESIIKAEDFLKE